jgi:predicted RNA binding protein YcfA (HicA-like mRNA interferase family)
VKEISGKKLAKAISRKGWYLARVKGSHHIYVKEGRPERIVIPIHGSRPLKVGLLRSLLKTAGLSEDEI